MFSTIIHEIMWAYLVPHDAYKYLRCIDKRCRDIVDEDYYHWWVETFVCINENGNNTVSLSQHRIFVHKKTFIDDKYTPTTVYIPFTRKIFINYIISMDVKIYDYHMRVDNLKNSAKFYDMIFYFQWINQKNTDIIHKSFRASGYDKICDQINNKLKAGTNFLTHTDQSTMTLNSENELTQVKIQIG